MGKIHAKTGKPQRAVKLGTEAVSAFEAYWGKDNKMYAEAAYDLACYKAICRKPKQALELMKECQPLFLKHLGPDHVKTKHIAMAIQYMSQHAG